MTRIFAGLALSALAALFSGCEKPPDPQTEYAIQFNMRCSTCNDFLACSAEGDTLVFRIHELSFWQQIATIADYLTFAQKTQRSRPLTIYRVDAEIIETDREGSIANIDTVAARVLADEFTINQRDGSLEVAGKTVGKCSTMSRRDGFGLVRKFLGRPLPGSDG